MFGGTLNMDACNLVDNRLTNPGGGSALVATAQPAAGAYPNWDVNGLIQNCVISNNSGGPATIYDGYRASAPFNRLQYRANQFYPADTSAFFLDGIGSRMSRISTHDLTLGDGSTVKKAPAANIALASAKPVGAVLMVPQMTSSSGAPGETLPLPAYLGYATSGPMPSLDGVAQRTPPVSSRLGE